MIRRPPQVACEWACWHRREDLPITLEWCEIYLVLARIIRLRLILLQLHDVRRSTNILSATRLPHSITESRLRFGLVSFSRNCALNVALGFASQPYDWFAFSRMMTLQALFPAELRFALRRSGFLA